MKYLPLLVLPLLSVALPSQASGVGDFFSGITVGAGYANDNAMGETFNGYSVYSQGYLVPSLKDNLFTDFRVTTTKADLDQAPDDAELTRYQASVGYGYPFSLTDSVVVKPYFSAGWSWDKVSQASFSDNENSFTASTGVRSEFGQHIVAGAGFSKETSGFKSGQWLVDVGYRF